MYGTPRLSVKCLAGQTLNSVCPPNHGRLGTKVRRATYREFCKSFCTGQPDPDPGVLRADAHADAGLLMLVWRGASEDGSDSIIIILHHRPIPAFPPSKSA